MNMSTSIGLLATMYAHVRPKNHIKCRVVDTQEGRVLEDLIRQIAIETCLYDSKAGLNGSILPTEYSIFLDRENFTLFTELGLSDNSACVFLIQIEKTPECMRPEVGFSSCPESRVTY